MTDEERWKIEGKTRDALREVRKTLASLQIEIEEYADKLKSASDNRSSISLVFFFSFLFVISYPVTSLWRWMMFEISGWRGTRKAIKRFHALDNKEKEILNLYITRNVRTQYFDASNGTVADLRLRAVLLVPVQSAHPNHIPHVLADWAWNYLHKHPDLLK